MIAKLHASACVFIKIHENNYTENKGVLLHFYFTLDYKWINWFYHNHLSPNVGTI